MTRGRRSFGLAALAALAFAVANAFAAPPATEEQVKAVFLFNFASFVEWPESTMPPAGEPFSICTLGEQPFGAALEEACRGENVFGRALSARVVESAAELAACQVAFIGRDHDASIADVLAALKRRGVLTVGETDRFASAGGMIRFRIVQSRVRFEIDSQAAEAAGLRVSSHLMKLAIAAER